MNARILVLVATFASVPVAAAGAQDDRAEEVRRKLEADVAAIGEAFGMEPIYEPLFGSLAVEQSETHRLELEAGPHYLIIAVCDSHCEDLSLWLWDADREKIVAGGKAGDLYPMEPGSISAVFNLEVEMSTCAVAPCHYGVQVLF